MKINSTILFTFLTFALIQNTNGQTIDQNAVDGHLYVKFHDFTAVSQNESGTFHFDGMSDVNEILSKYDIEKAYNSFEGTPSELLMKTYRISIKDAAQVANMIEDLAKLKSVDYAEQVPLFYPTLTPNDLGNQSGSPNQWGLYQIDAEDAWDITLGDPTVIVAIVDDAVDRLTGAYTECIC